LTAQINEKQKVVEKLKAERNTALATLKDTQAKKNVLKDQKKEFDDKLKQFIEAVKQQKDVLKAARASLPIKNMPKGFEGTMSQADKALIEKNEEYYSQKIAEIENVLKSKKMPLGEEKKLVHELNNLSIEKKTKIRDFQRVVAHASIGENPEIQKLKAAIKEKDDKIKELIEIEKGQLESWRGITTKLDGIRDTLTKQRDERTALYNSLDELSKQYKTIQVEITEKKKKWNEEQKSQWEKQKEEREKVWKQRDEERKKRQAEREAYLESLLPYETELDVCDEMITYLENLLPKKQENVSSGKKQTRSNLLIHPQDVIRNFEDLSLKTPLMAEEVEKSLEEVKGKRTHYKQLQEEEIKRRAAAKEAAAKAAAESAANAATEAKETPAVEDGATEAAAQPEATPATTEPAAVSEESAPAPAADAE